MSFKPRFRVIIITLIALVSTTTGCSSVIVGTFDGGAPPDGSDFHISRATFKDDDTFTVFAKTADGEGQILRGTYQFNGVSLIIKQAGKKARKYSTTYNSFTRSLDISAEGARQTLKKM